MKAAPTPAKTLTTSSKASKEAMKTTKVAPSSTITSTSPLSKKVSFNNNQQQQVEQQDMQQQQQQMHLMHHHQLAYTQPFTYMQPIYHHPVSAPLILSTTPHINSYLPAPSLVAAAAEPTLATYPVPHQQQHSMLSPIASAALQDSSDSEAASISSRKATAKTSTTQPPQQQEQEPMLNTYLSLTFTDSLPNAVPGFQGDAQVSASISTLPTTDSQKCISQTRSALESLQKFWDTPASDGGTGDKGVPKGGGMLRASFGCFVGAVCPSVQELRECLASLKNEGGDDEATHGSTGSKSVSDVGRLMMLLELIPSMLSVLVTDIKAWDSYRLLLRRASRIVGSPATPTSSAVKTPLVHESKETQTEAEELTTKSSKETWTTPLDCETVSTQTSTSPTIETVSTQTAIVNRDCSTQTSIATSVDPLPEPPRSPLQVLSARPPSTNHSESNNLLPPAPQKCHSAGSQNGVPNIVLVANTEEEMTAINDAALKRLSGTSQKRVSMEEQGETEQFLGVLVEQSVNDSTGKDEESTAKVLIPQIEKKLEETSGFEEETHVPEHSSTAALEQPPSSPLEIKTVEAPQPPPPRRLSREDLAKERLSASLERSLGRPRSTPSKPEEKDIESWSEYEESIRTVDSGPAPFDSDTDTTTDDEDEEEKDKSVVVEKKVEVKEKVGAGTEEDEASEGAEGRLVDAYFEIPSFDGENVQEVEGLESSLMPRQEENVGVERVPSKTVSETFKTLSRNGSERRVLEPLDSFGEYLEEEKKEVGVDLEDLLPTAAEAVSVNDAGSSELTGLELKKTELAPEMALPPAIPPRTTVPSLTISTKPVPKSILKPTRLPSPRQQPSPLGGPPSSSSASFSSSTSSKLKKSIKTLDTIRDSTLERPQPPPPLSGSSQNPNAFKVSKLNPSSFGPPPPTGQDLAERGRENGFGRKRSKSISDLRASAVVEESKKEKEVGKRKWFGMFKRKKEGQGQVSVGEASVPSLSVSTAGNHTSLQQNLAETGKKEEEEGGEEGTGEKKESGVEPSSPVVNVPLGPPSSADSTVEKANTVSAKDSATSVGLLKRTRSLGAKSERAGVNVGVVAGWVG
ncbi:hypothetical protein HDV05_004565 [Chytridiales sp. JEL 0842]|nr:hypothetical protein HDV05_004565 [Chytridiales sp. JEL 0842]